MRMKETLRAIALAASFTASSVAPAAAQQQQQPAAPAQVQQEPAQKRGGILGKIFGEGKQKKSPARRQQAGAPQPSATPAERLEGDDTNTMPADVSAETQANRREQMSEEVAMIAPYYNNFFTTYRLGPEDVISVTVFGHERYSRAGVTIPPSGRVSLPLIPGGVLVNGKTVEQVAAEVTKQYDEYIIDPKVDVSIDKAVSYRYSVIGDVGQPGIKIMTRRMTVTEALAESGGVLRTGDSKKVVVLRRGPDNRLSQIPINVAEIYKGKRPDDVYLVPGDQVIVPGNRIKQVEKFLSCLPVLSFARIFTGGF